MLRSSWWKNINVFTWFKQVHRWCFSPDLRISFSTWPAMLLASCSLFRRRFWDSLRGLVEASAALQTCPTTGAEWMRSPQPVSKIPVSAIITTQTDHLIVASGCRVTVGCSTSVLTSRVGNARPSPWLQETGVTSPNARTFKRSVTPLLCLLPGEHRQEPVLLLVSKDLRDILLKTQREAVLVGASSKDGRSEGLCRHRPLNSEHYKCIPAVSSSTSFIFPFYHNTVILSS